MTERRYNIRGLSPKAFLIAVYQDETVDLPLRIDAADKASRMLQPGDFCEPDLSYTIPELVLQ